MGGVEVKIHTLQNLELVGSEWSASQSDSFTAGERTLLLLDRLVGSMSHSECDYKEKNSDSAGN
jgi:hypothetical protein